MTGLISSCYSAGMAAAAIARKYGGNTGTKQPRHMRSDWVVDMATWSGFRDGDLFMVTNESNVLVCGRRHHHVCSVCMVKWHLTLP